MDRSIISKLFLSLSNTHRLDKFIQPKHHEDGRVRGGRTCLLDPIKEPARRRHPERPHRPDPPQQHLAYLRTPSSPRRSSPAAPTPPCASLLSAATPRHATPRLSPKSKSHAHPARGGLLLPCIYRQKRGQG
jgi:hypothetical protein